MQDYNVAVTEDQHRETVQFWRRQLTSVNGGFRWRTHDAAARDGDWATASWSGGSLVLDLHYLMTCGEPGPGPVVVRLPAAFRITSLRVLVRGARRPAALNGTRLTIRLPKPPEVTCMSIVEGRLHVAISKVRAAGGTYAVRAAVGDHAFAPRVRVP